MNGEPDESVNNTFYLEESNVQLNGFNDDLKAFKQCCSGLREAVWSAWECKKNKEKINSSTFASLLLAMKQLNRRTQFRLRKARDRTVEQKLGVDKLHLNLQNFLYEVSHLESEIKTCLEFKSKHENLNLISVEEFCRATGCDVSTSSNHDIILKRLYWENEQRKNLSLACENLQKIVESTERKIQEKQEYLASLGPKLKEVADYTLETQELMKMPFTKEGKQHRLAYLLPSPLYILYANVKSYLTVSDQAAQLTVEILGDAQLAKAINQSSSERPTVEADESDADADVPMEKKRKTGRHKGKLQIDTDREAVHNKMSTHPLSVVVKLIHEFNDSVSSSTIQLELQLTFFWVLSLKVVSVDCRLNPLSDQSVNSSSANDLLFSEHLLSNLEWTSGLASYGSQSCSDFPLLPMDRLHERWDTTQPIGRPFPWAQTLCDCHCLFQTDTVLQSDNEKSYPTPHLGSDTLQTSAAQRSDMPLGRIDDWIRALHKRIDDRIILMKELAHIESGNPILSAAQQNLLPPSIPGRAGGVKLANWRRATFTDLQAVARAQIPCSLNLILPSDTIFQCEFRQGDTWCAPVWVALPPAYPHRPPLLIVEGILPGAKSLPGLSELTFMDLESEVNCYWQEFFANGAVDSQQLLLSNILSCQLARCACCLEALWKGFPVQPRSTEETASVANYFVKYPTRGPPLRYLPSLGVHIHR